MSLIIHPRSPQEIMDGWVHLPRYVDKIHLHLAGRLHSDYEANLGKGLLDRLWLQAAGLSHEQMIAVVRPTLTDGEFCDWVRQHVKQSVAEKAVHREATLGNPPAEDASGQPYLQQSNVQFGLGQRDDIRTIVDYIDADEGRLFCGNSEAG
jgi:hypothetical protein